MYKPNKRHLQPLLISNVHDLPEKHQKRLEKSWAGVFYRELFCRLKEEPFTVLYADIPSRPNIPVNVLVGLETIKSGFGWSDEELYDHFVFDLQVRYALGYHDLKEGDFDLRTLYNFRQRLSKYNREHGVNLLEQAFVDITDQQIISLKLDTSKQRMDSTQIASNIMVMSRLQLLVEAFQRLYRCLSAEDQQHYAGLFAPYLKGASGQYVYRIKGEEATRRNIQQVGEAMHHVRTELEGRYEQEPVFQVFRRFFEDNFQLTQASVRAKENREISSDCLQSCDDLEATFRRKGEQEYKGYVANLSQTCAPDNPVQLITNIQTAPNNVEDSDLLIDALPDLKDRTGVKTLYTDGGYGSPEVDQVLQKQRVDLVATAIKGCKPDPQKLTLGYFDIRLDEKGIPNEITCPGGQTVRVRWGRKKGALVADFDRLSCEACPFHKSRQCRAKPGKRDKRFHLDFSLNEAYVARRRRLKQEHERSGRNLRSAVEAAARSIKHPFSNSKLPVRGLFRVSCMIIGSALMSNIRSIHRYLEDWEKEEKKQKKEQEQVNCSPDFVNFSFLTSVLTHLTRFYRPLSWRLPCFSS
jgi:hypothetical protein